jgi:hypothetical protein
LRLDWSEQERNYGDIRGFSLGIRLDLVADRKDDSILQNRCGERLGRTVRAAGDEDVEVGARDEKSGHADNFVGAQGYGAHAVRNLAGETCARAGSSEIATEDRLIFGEWIENRTAVEFGDSWKCTVDEGGCGPCDQLRVVGPE